jgi:hypothetical protein
MTSLDTLARDSARAVHTSVVDVPVPAGGIAVAAQTAAVWRMAGFAFAGATAGVAVVFALLIAAPTLDDPADDVVSTTNAVVPIVPTPVVDLNAPPTTHAPIPQEDPAAIAALPQDTESDPVPDPADVEPPILELISPNDGEHVELRVVTFSGVTDPGASVLASGKFPADVDPNGAWSVDLVLSPGANGVVFSATDAAGNVEEIRATVHLDVEESKVEVPPVEEPKETTTTTVAEWLFTANQRYGWCSEPVPYDVFSGTAVPGSIVNVSSPHGNGVAEVNDDGAWNVRVEFVTASYNEEFTVKVMDHKGSMKNFAFVSKFEG